jgi:hypothetical protein
MLMVRRNKPIGVLLLCTAALVSLPAFAQIDATGEWSPRLHEDRPERGAGPDVGELPSMWVPSRTCIATRNGAFQSLESLLVIAGGRAGSWRRRSPRSISLRYVGTGLQQLVIVDKI